MSNVSDDALRCAGHAVLTAKIAASIAHDINNALTVALTSLNALAQEFNPGTEPYEIAAESRSAMQAILEWNRLLFELSDHRPPSAPSEIDLRVLVRDTVALGVRHDVMRGVNVAVAVADSRLLLRGHKALLRRAILNLLLNAGESAGKGGRVQIGALPHGDDVMLFVDDNGPGLAPEHRQRILEPFFTTKPAGIGLGLVSVVAAAEFHGGDLRIDVSPLGGARFELLLKGGGEAHSIPTNLTPG